MLISHFRLSLIFVGKKRRLSIFSAPLGYAPVFLANVRYFLEVGYPLFSCKLDHLVLVDIFITALKGSSLNKD